MLLNCRVWSCINHFPFFGYHFPIDFKNDLSLRCYKFLAVCITHGNSILTSGRPFLPFAGDLSAEWPFTPGEEPVLVPRPHQVSSEYQCPVITIACVYFEQGLVVE